MLTNRVLLLLFLTFHAALVVAYDAVVVIKASSALDVQALKDVEGTAAVYKVKRLNFYANKVYQGKHNPRGKYTKVLWNYLVLGKGFDSAEEKTAFVTKISSFNFVEEHSSIGLTVNPHVDATELNKIMANIPKENLVERPLKLGRGCGTCEDVIPDNVGADGRVVSISFSKYGDEKALKKYAGDLLQRVFPSLGVRYVYSGISDEEDFDGFTILDYGSKEAWCEYARSQLLRDSIPQFMKSFQAMAALSAVEV